LRGVAGKLGELEVELLRSQQVKRSLALCSRSFSYDAAKKLIRCPTRFNPLCGQHFALSFAFFSFLISFCTLAGADIGCVLPCFQSVEIPTVVLEVHKTIADFVKKVRVAIA
jgi:hypothetical protein